MYRDWNTKLKDALEQKYKNKEFIDIMDHIENASDKWRQQSKRDNGGAEEDHAILVKDEEWHKLAGHLKSILVQKMRRKERRIPKRKEKCQWTVRVA